MKKPPESQRKSPQQGRSKALVDAIFEATVRILPKIGSEKITTKKIADLAGVSIGSLYQYFPNKESVLSALMESFASLHSSSIQKKLDEVQGKSMEESVSLMVDSALEIFLGEKWKTREIFMLAPELGMMPTIYKFRQIGVERLADEMERHAPGKTREEYMRISFIAANSLMGVVHTMLYDETQTYSIADLSTELKVMLLAYFRECGRWATQTSGGLR
jgi:AcrR family transcriptional regulator